MLLAHSARNKQTNLFDRLGVKASHSRADGRGSHSDRFTSPANLPDALHDSVSAKTGWPVVATP